MFNPFQKPLDQIQIDDLHVLRRIPEGWYIEYKSAPIKPREIAKSLTSFANQYGGYLFFGVKESATGDLTASEFPGIANSEVPILQTHVRDSAASHSNPSFHFESILLAGPCPKIGLPTGRSILIVRVEAGVLSPYIHSSGRIYRRVGDSAEPKPAADPIQLTELLDRRNRENKRIQKFISDHDPTARRQGIDGWMQLYFFPDPNEPVKGRELCRNAMSEVFGADTESRLGLRAPMQSVYPSGLGYTARQTDENQPTILGMTAHVAFSGYTSFSIPISIQQIGAFDISRYEHAASFVEHLTNRGYESVRVADFSKLIVAMAALINHYLQLKDLLEDDRPVIAGFKLSGLLGICPFVDSKFYVSNARTHGIPLLDIESVHLPSDEPSVDTLVKLNFVPLDESDANLSSHVRPYRFGYSLMAIALSCIGVSSFLDDAEMRVFSDLIGAFDNNRTVDT